jgi:hypothetical protein
MFAHERTQYAFLFGFARLLVTDVPDEKMTEQPGEQVSHPAWTLGHLCAAADQGLKLLNGPTLFSDAWHELFFRRVRPSPDRAQYPSKELLLVALAKAHAVFSAVAALAPAELVNADNPKEQSRPSFPTVGDVVAYFMTTHEAMHLGEISAWRRAMGMNTYMGE